MSDTDATCKRHRVADPLRERVDAVCKITGLSGERLYAIADQIDREHERRMYQQSHDLRKAFCRYIGGVLDDYKHGIKRKRLRK